MRIGLLIAYPVFAHLGVMLEQSILQIIAISSLAAGIFYSGLKSFKISAWISVIGITAVSAGFGLFYKPIFLLFLPPIALPLLVSWGFLRTLFPGQTPLVTAIGEKARGKFSPEMRAYTRCVTILWAACLLMMTSWAILLPLFGSLELWSIFTNIVNHALVFSLFVGEFIYRTWRFRDQSHPRFFEYLRIVFRAQGNSD